jgi:hypothetical protein
VGLAKVEGLRTLNLREGILMSTAVVGAGGVAAPLGGVQVKTDSGQAQAGSTDVANRIAGLPVLNGLVVYGATLMFAAFYGYFIAEIASAATNHPPKLDRTMVAAAAALAGVLGSAFALYVGLPSDTTNEDLERALAKETDTSKKRNFWRRQNWWRRFLSLEPSGRHRASWPLTCGVWVYAIVATAVALVYVLNQGETPASIRTIAIGFAGYVVSFMTAAYGLSGTGKKT